MHRQSQSAWPPRTANDAALKSAASPANDAAHESAACSIRAPSASQPSDAQTAQVFKLSEVLAKQAEVEVQLAEQAEAETVKELNKAADEDARCALQQLSHSCCHLAG